MALLNKEIRLAWDSLSGDSSSDGWRTIPIASLGTCSIVAGRKFPSNTYAMLIGFSEVKLSSINPLPEGQGFTVERVTLPDESRTWIALSRNDCGSEELFLSMVQDVIDLLATQLDFNEPYLLNLFLGRVRAWQEFMRVGAGCLSPEAEIGLDVALDSWVGSLNAIQDFELGTGAIEVKSTLSSIGFPARIGSLQQLDDSLRQPLFLACFRLKQVASGSRLPVLIDFLEEKFRVQKDLAIRFSDKLLRAHYFLGHKDFYTRSFEVDQLRVLEVHTSFPRLTRGALNFAITDASYVIDVDRISEPSMELSDTLIKLGVF
jgi:Putative  PD-(D/E)XK family member, (DUF4420)